VDEEENRSVPKGRHQRRLGARNASKLAGVFRDPNLPIMEDQNKELDDISFSTGLCVSCGKPTSNALVALVAEDAEPDHYEPFICNRCLAEINREVYTELKLRNRVTNLASEIKGLETRVWYRPRPLRCSGLL
jgi:hypothetical protein